MIALYNFKEKYNYYLDLFEGYLSKNLDLLTTTPDIIGESMRYSLLAGGKRIRPILLLAVADVLGVQMESVLPFELSLEMIHTYSLIHDDLPAMDNDDFRRGNPSNHKKFGEAMAILAGDGLLNTAYALCFKACAKGDACLRSAQFLCECAGINGMIAGQAMDIQYSNSESEHTNESLEKIHRLKTGKLLLAPIVIPSIVKNYKYYFELEEFAENFGLLFQITDDILDEEGSFEDLGKSIGKDKEENKVTFVTVYGLDGAKIQADLYTSNCLRVLDALDGDTEFLRDLVEYTRTRKK